MSDNYRTCERCHGDGVDYDGDECQRCLGWGEYEVDTIDADDDPSWDAHK